MNRTFLIFLFIAFAAVLSAERPTDSALKLYRAKDYPAAQAALEKIAADEPQNAEAQFYLGVVAEKRGENEVAIQHLEQATTLAPTNSTYSLELGGAYGTAVQKADFLSKMSW